MNLENLNHSSNKELRLPPVARPRGRKYPMGTNPSWKIKGKKARVLWNADHSLGVITLPWSGNLTLIHKHILSEAQLGHVLTQMVHVGRIDTRNWVRVTKDPTNEEVIRKTINKRCTRLVQK